MFTLFQNFVGLADMLEKTETVDVKVDIDPIYPDDQESADEDLVLEEPIPELDDEVVEETF